MGESKAAPLESLHLDPDLRPFLREFARRPSMWVGRPSFPVAVAFLQGLLLGRGRDEEYEVRLWWEARHGSSPLHWTDHVFEDVTGTFPVGELDPETTTRAIECLCAELIAFFDEMVNGGSVPSRS